MIKAGMYISDRYEIIDKVGSGGMADVYKALCHRLNRYVAIKILKPEYSTDAGFVQKFRGEAQSVAGLSHPNIVSVYDVGEDDGLYYIVMELVEGITLKRFIEKRKKLDVKEAVGIAIQIAMGMEAAHTHHIIHRDIKPQNIIISREGKVKVADFGIAKAATSNTISQNAIGSVHYLSPEQARGGYSDERSDIYSLGVTLYEMLTGQVPFAGDNSVSVALLHIQSEAVPVREINPDVPLSVDKIIQKCMQKKPERRYQTAADLIIDLKRSVINPEGDYVNIPSSTGVDPSPTRNITEEELETIKSVAKTPPKRVVYSDRKTKKKVKRETEELDSMDSGLEKVLTVISVLAAIALIVFIIWIAKRVFFDNNGGSIFPQTETNNPTTPTPTEVVTPAIKVPATEPPTPSPTSIEDDLKDLIDVRGKSEEEAKLLLQQISPYFTILSEIDYNDNVPNGFVAEQNPAAYSTVRANATIYLTVSAGAHTDELYNVAEMEADQAVSFLEKLGYKVTKDTEFHDTVPAGNVTRTDPEGGSMVPKNSEVKVYISLGRKIVYTECPQIVGLKLKKGQEELLKAKLVPVENPAAEYSDSFDEGVIISQTVEAGTQVEEGAVIEFVVSLGSEPTPTPEPTPDEGADRPGLTVTPEPSPTPIPTDAPVTPEPDPTKEPTAEPEPTKDPGYNPEDPQNGGTG
jgi:serine/threonine-protein kinase